MFNPEMMAAAQKMMANMKPEDMQRMSQMAANMDPKVMEGMMKNMNGGQMPGNVDTAEALNQMKNMTPEQMRAGMSQAQNQMNAQKTYYCNAAEVLKNEGNAAVKKEDYAGALQKYTKALENLKPHSGTDVDALKVNLLNNSALCYLKTKDYDSAYTACQDSLKVSPSNYKALFRRGSALESQGKLKEGFLDLHQASTLAPNDAAVSRELARLRAELKVQGLDEDEVLASAKPMETPTTSSPSPSAPSGSAGGSSSSSMPNLSQDQWSAAAERMAENPDMFRQASEMMKNMSPEQLQSMMGSNMPPGMDAATMKSQMEMLEKNPDMFKSAMDGFKNMPEAERKRLLAQRAGSSSSSAATPAVPRTATGAPDMKNMSPEMMTQALNMTKNLTPEQLKAMNINSPQEAEMMQQTAAQLQSNPEMMDMMMNMMKNMDEKQMQDMMKMSAGMRGASGAGAGPDGQMDPSAMMNDPQMRKAAEDMMSNMTPEMLASMSKAMGVEIGEDKAKLITKFLPYLMKLMRLFYWLKGIWTAHKMRLIIAFVVVIVAMLQRWWSG
mmetsp:Transcript_53631/g.114513  ORF Transcript_53631/g.114513 Transcript_53631/m.114513 type:complete len:554 (+) Transcript_53631:306-1967(+)